MFKKVPCRNGQFWKYRRCTSVFRVSQALYFVERFELTTFHHILIELIPVTGFGGQVTESDLASKNWQQISYQEAYEMLDNAHGVTPIDY